MLSVTPAQRAALASGAVSRLLFVWCDARDPDDGSPAPAGFFTGSGSTTIGTRTYHGSGLVAVSTLSAVGDMAIPGLTVTLSGLSALAASLIRGSTVGQRPIDVQIGLYDPLTRAMIGGLIPRFTGVVDDIEIKTPEAGGQSVAELICESTSRALTIKRTETRSSASQQARDPADKFYDYTAVQRTKPIYFGRKAPKDVKKK